MKQRIYAFCLVLTLAGCSSSTNVAPKNSIPKDSMVMIIKDIHLLEGSLEPGLNNSLVLDSIKGYYGGVMQKYGLDSLRFVSNMRYYLENPKLMTEIYQEVIDSLSSLEAQQH